MNDNANTNGPVLRALSPALRALEKSLRAWLDSEHKVPLSREARANLERIAVDLRRHADTLDMEKPLLVVMLMGGTGVGKSTLLNALAGGNIAQASFARPTTRDPVVYFHESVPSSRLDPALQHCRLTQHDRSTLEQKVLVDTPDLDSNDLANREKLHEILPVADVVLYVGSQEKYHDKMGWDLFLHQRQRRAFAFVLNKWDRCIHRGASGVRPDEDLIRDLTAEGFANPLLFRTCAQHWVDQGEGNGQASPPVEGEQFRDLTRWLELGLTRMEIEAIKARGVGQLLTQLQHVLGTASPPDLSQAAARTRESWKGVLREEADASARILIETLDPFQREIEHHFSAQRQGHFRGVMGGYLSIFNKLKYAGSQLRVRIPFAPRIGESSEPQTRLNLAEFTRTCSAAASDRHLDARGKALANRLLLDADRQQFPLEFLTGPTEAAAKLDWRQRYSQAMVEVLSKVEQKWSRPTGLRRYLQGAVVLLADWLPGGVFVAALAIVLWRFFGLSGLSYPIGLLDMFLPVLLMLSVCIILHVFVSLLFPLRWQAIRDEFQRHLASSLHKELVSAYEGIPQSIADQLLAEKRRIDQVLHDTNEVQCWLAQREQAASVESMYGK